MLTEKEHLFVTAAEEAGEIAKAALEIQMLFHKTLRFGEQSTKSIHEGRLAEAFLKLRAEYNDFIGAIEALEECGADIDLGNTVDAVEFFDDILVGEKIDKIRNHYAIAIENGAMSLPENKV